MSAVDSTTDPVNGATDANAAIRGIFSQAAVGIAQCDAEGRIILANHKLCDMLGYQPDELVGVARSGLGHPDDRERTEQLVAKLETGRLDSFTIEKRFVRKDGSPIWVNSTVSAIRDESGAMQTLVTVVQDISDKREAESAYRRSAEQIEQLYRLSNAVIRAEDVSRIFHLALDGLQETLGADRAAVLLYDANNVMRFKAWVGLSDEYRALAEGHSPWSKDAKDPQAVLVSDIAEDPSLAGLRDRIMAHGIRALGFIPLVVEDSLLGKLMIYYDSPHSFSPDEVQVAQTIANHVAFAISRKLSEQKLRLYQQIVHNSIDGISIIDPQGRYLEQNRAHSDLLGFDFEDLQGHTPAMHLGEPMFQKLIESLTRTGLYRGEAISTTKDGHQVAIEIAAFGVAGEDGKPSCFVGIKRDISERKKAEFKLRESEERFRVMADTAPVMLWVADPDGRCIWFNKPWLDFTGRPMSEELGYGWCENIHADDLQEIRTAFRDAYAARRPVEMEYRLKRADGEYRWILDHGVPRFNPDGEFIGYVGSCKDITDRIRAMQTVEQANQELERHVQERTAELTAANQELEGFTYSVSHDLRAPLRAIIATSRILLEECTENLSSTHCDMLKRQAENAKRLGILIDDLLKLSRLSRQEMVREAIDLTALAHEVADDLLTREWARPMAFMIQKDMIARGDQKLIRFVLLNLMENACKFSPKGGAVEVGCREGAFFVRDSGIGFDMEYAPKVFLPFERLVRDDDFPGTGIGLANVKRIVERHGGHVSVQSAPGQGSTFSFTFPE